MFQKKLAHVMWSSAAARGFKTPFMTCIDPDFELISLHPFLSREIRARNAKGPKEMAPEFGASPPREPPLVSRRPAAGGFRNFGALRSHRTRTGTRTGLGPLSHLLAWPRAADFVRAAGAPSPSWPPAGPAGLDRGCPAPCARTRACRRDSKPWARARVHGMT